MDRLADVPPGVVRFGEGVAVPRPLGGGVPDDAEQVAVEPVLAEASAGCEALRVALDDEGVPAPAARAQLAGDDDGAVAWAARRPVVLGPLTDFQFEPELVHDGDNGVRAFEGSVR